MARNGSGTYTLVSGNPVVTGTTITSTWANNTLSDIATALTNSLAYDGQTNPIANIPLAGFKLTGLGAATTAGDALRYEQLAAADISIKGITVTGTATTRIASVMTSTVNANTGVAPTGSYAYGSRLQPTLVANAINGVLVGTSTEPTYTATGQTGCQAISVYADITTTAAAFTLLTAYGLYSDTPSLGAGSAITTYYGLYVGALTAAATNYAIYTEANGLVSFGDAVTCRTQLNVTGRGALGGTTSTTSALRVVNTLSGGADQIGTESAPTFGSGTTSSGRGLSAQILTAAAAFTMTNAYGLYVDTPSKGAASAITNAYGVYVNTQSAGATLNYAFYSVSGRFHIGSIPTSAAGLVTGDVWANTNVLTIVP